MLAFLSKFPEPQLSENDHPDFVSLYMNFRVKPLLHRLTQGTGTTTKMSFTFNTTQISPVLIPFIMITREKQEEGCYITDYPGFLTRS